MHDSTLLIGGLFARLIVDYSGTRNAKNCNSRSLFTCKNVFSPKYDCSPFPVISTWTAIISISGEESGIPWGLLAFEIFWNKLIFYIVFFSYLFLLQILGALFQSSSVNHANFDGRNKVESELTDLGFHIARLPLDPQLARLLLFGVALKCLDPVITLVAVLSYRDPC